MITYTLYRFNSQNSIVQFEVEHELICNNFKQ